MSQQITHSVDLDAEAILQRLAEKQRLVAEQKAEDAARTQMVGKLVSPCLPSVLVDAIEALKPKRPRSGAGVVGAQLTKSFSLAFHSRDIRLTLAQLQDHANNEEFEVPSRARLSLVTAHIYWIKWSSRGKTYAIRIQLMNPASRQHSYWRLVAADGFNDVQPHSHALPRANGGRYIPGNRDYDA